MYIAKKQRDKKVAEYLIEVFFGNLKENKKLYRKIMSSSRYND